MINRCRWQHRRRLGISPFVACKGMTDMSAECEQFADHFMATDTILVFRSGALALQASKYQTGHDNLLCHLGGGGRSTTQASPLLPTRKERTGTEQTTWNGAEVEESCLNPEPQNSRQQVLVYNIRPRSLDRVTLLEGLIYLPSPGPVTKNHDELFMTTSLQLKVSCQGQSEPFEQALAGGRG